MFIILPVGVDYNARRYPVVSFTLMGLCTAVYLVTLGLAAEYGKAAYQWSFLHLWLIPEKSLWWTYLTSLFVHGGFFHLLGNMIYLFLFGACVEDIIGRVRFTVFYFVCGLVAEFAYIGMTPAHFASTIPMGGASGAISGCLGGFMLLQLRTQIDFKWFSFFFFRPASGDFTLPAWLVVSAWFLKDLAFAILTAAIHTSRGGVAFGAHVGGTLCGLGLISLEKLLSKGSLSPGQVSPKPLATRSAAGIGVRASGASTPAEPQDIYLYMDGTQIGPFRLSQIRGMFALGSISEGTLYWKDGMEDWHAVEELHEARTPT
jgi:membrane associated rhomboid family serine protease